MSDPIQFQLRVPCKVIAALHCLASHDSSRPAIAGVRVEIEPGQPTLLVATDGRRMGIHKLSDAVSVSEKEGRELAPTAFTIPNTIIDLIVNNSDLVGHLAVITFEYRRYPENKFAQISTPGMVPNLSAQEVDSAFPKWRHVIPADLGSEYAADSSEVCIGIDQFAYVQRCAEAIGANGLTLHARKDGPIVVTFFGQPDFCVLQMPLNARCNSPIPEWFEDLALPTAPAAPPAPPA